MEYGRAVKFPLKSEGWVSKVLIGVVVSLVPILNWAVYGYGIEVMRRVALGEGDELPRWDRLGRYLARGVALTVAGFLYLLPGLLLFALLALAGGDQSLLPVGLAVYVLYSLVLVFVLPMASVRYAITDRWFTMFDFGWVLSEAGRNLLTLVAVFVIWMIVSLVLMILGMIVFGIGALFASFWSIMMISHLLGQVGRRSLMRASAQA
ncbi:MAG: hypothetical protein Kow00129_06510 [Thermoleophilia bacterium]